MVLLRVFRYGGEEFVVILNHADANTAKEIAERVLKRIQSRNIVHETSLYGIVTISGGIQEYNDVFAKPEEVIRAADHKLYIAKDEGRNRFKV